MSLQSYSRLRKHQKEEAWLLTIVTPSSEKEGSIALKLDIPGGKRELGENSRNGAIRECREELGAKLILHNNNKLLHEDWIETGSFCDKAMDYFILNRISSNEMNATEEAPESLVASEALIDSLAELSL